MEEVQFIQAVEKIRVGDKQGLKEIYEAYIGYVYSIVYQMIQNKENAEDVTSEFFLRLWEKAGQYKAGNGGHRGYLATIARNMSIDFMRKHGREQLVDVTEDTENATENIGDKISLQQEYSSAPVEQEVIEELSMQEALDKLEIREREIIHLKVMGELTFQEIAEVLKMPMGTVTWKYRKALEKLRRCGYHE